MKNGTHIIDTSGMKIKPASVTSSGKIKTIKPVTGVKETCLSKPQTKFIAKITLFSL